MYVIMFFISEEAVWAVDIKQANQNKPGLFWLAWLIYVFLEDIFVGQIAMTANVWTFKLQSYLQYRWFEKNILYLLVTMQCAFALTELQ